MDKVRTVSDTKRDFYSYHSRPINSIYRRVVEELMVEMHLLSVNAEFSSDPFYCLGVVTSFDRFMQGYRPEKDQDSIFSALCRSVGGNPQEYRQEADQVLSLGKRLSSTEEIISWFESPTPVEGEEKLAEAVEKITRQPKFKYSRLFAIGLYTLIETVDSEAVKDEKQRNQLLDKIAEMLHVSNEKLKKDLELYRGNLEKMDQLLNVLKESLSADRKKREQRSQAKEQAS